MRPAVLFTLLVVGLSAAGCGTRQSKGTAGNAVKAVEDPWPAAAAAVRKEATPAGLTRILGDLSAAAGAEPRFGPDALSPAAEAAVKDLARLTDADLKALRPAGYTPLDAQYLADCLYLRDVARSLEADGLPPAEQAARAFAWVCRQVAPAPWAAPGRSAGAVTFFPPVPPSFALRRGSGSGLERAYVTLALCQQLGLDAVLVGPPAAADATWKDNQTPGQPPRGPFWAVGVRAGGDVLLFDAWAGAALNGADGKPLALAQAVADPAKVPGVPADRVKASVPFVSVPVPALAPRLRRLEAELKADSGVRLFVDLPGLVKSFADATKLAPPVWNPPADPTAYPKALAGFLPPAAGGAVPTERYDQFRGSLLPVQAMPVPVGLDLNLPENAALQVPLSAVQQGALGRFSRHFLNTVADGARGASVGRLPSNPAAIGQFLEDPALLEKVQKAQQAAGPGAFVPPLESLPTLRERVQRNLQPDPVKALVERRAELLAADTRGRADRTLPQRVEAWAAAARPVYAAYLRALDRNTPFDPAALAEVGKAHGPTLAALEDAAAVPAELAEATYQLAQAKHEQAEREQARADRKPTDDGRRRAADAWAEARGWWTRFRPLGEAVAPAFPGRVEHARTLADRASR